MFSKKSILSIFLTILTLSFSFSLVSNLNNFGVIFFLISLVVLINVFFKELAAYYYDLKIEHIMLEIKQYGFKAHDHFKKPFPIGILLPIFTSVLSAGYFIWMGILTFEAKAEVYRVAKRRGFYGYSESSEFHEGIIALIGVIGSILVGGIGILIGNYEFTKLSFFYAFFNTIPFWKLDGNKILFSEVIFSKVAFIVSLALALCGILFF